MNNKNERKQNSGNEDTPNPGAGISYGNSMDAGRDTSHPENKAQRAEQGPENDRVGKPKVNNSGIENLPEDPDRIPPGMDADAASG